MIRDKHLGKRLMIEKTESIEDPAGEITGVTFHCVFHGEKCSATVSEMELESEHPIVEVDCPEEHADAFAEALVSFHWKALVRLYRLHVELITDPDPDLCFGGAEY